MIYIKLYNIFTCEQSYSQRKDNEISSESSHLRVSYINIISEIITVLQSNSKLT